MDNVAALRKYNRWRRGLDAWHEDAGPNPREIGEQIDAVCDEIELLRKLLRKACGKMSYGHWSSEFRQDVERALSGVPNV